MDSLDLIKQEIIDSEISGKDLRIVIDIINKYKKVSIPDTVSLPNRTVCDNYIDYYKYCEHCSNNIKNGGSGVCHCILGTSVFY